MVYKYKCPQCEKQTEIKKPMSESSRVEYCEICESELVRVYSVGGIVTGDGVK